jgi:putative transposase
MTPSRQNSVVLRVYEKFRRSLCALAGVEGFRSLAASNNADLVGAINILERGYRLLACGELAQSGRSVKQEPTEATQTAFV